MLSKISQDNVFFLFINPHIKICLLPPVLKPDQPAYPCSLTRLYTIDSQSPTSRPYILKMIMDSSKYWMESGLIHLRLSAEYGLRTNPVALNISSEVTEVAAIFGNFHSLSPRQSH